MYALLDASAFWLLSVEELVVASLQQLLHDHPNILLLVKRIVFYVLSILHIMHFLFDILFIMYSNTFIVGGFITTVHVFLLGTVLIPATSYHMYQGLKSLAVSALKSVNRNCI